MLGDRRTTLATLDRALRAYDRVRRPFAQGVQDKSRENGLLYTLNYRGLTFERPAGCVPGSEDARRLEEIQRRIRAN